MSNMSKIKYENRWKHYLFIFRWGHIHDGTLLIVCWTGKMLANSLLSILILLLSPLIVLSNTLIISVWLRFKRLRTPSNALIISLAAADLGFGLFLPAAIALELTMPPNPSSGNIIKINIYRQLVVSTHLHAAKFWSTWKCS